MEEMTYPFCKISSYKEFIMYKLYYYFLYIYTVTSFSEDNLQNGYDIPFKIYFSLNLIIHVYAPSLTETSLFKYCILVILLYYSPLDR